MLYQYVTNLQSHRLFSFEGRNGPAEGGTRGELEKLREEIDSREDVSTNY